MQFLYAFMVRHLYAFMIRQANFLFKFIGRISKNKYVDSHGRFVLHFIFIKYIIKSRTIEKSGEQKLNGLSQKLNGLNQSLGGEKR